LHLLIACFLSNISAKYYENPTMLSRGIAKNIGDVFLRHSVVLHNMTLANSCTDVWWSCFNVKGPVQQRLKIDNSRAMYIQKNVVLSNFMQ